MIRVTSLRNLNPGAYQENYAIVRSLKSKSDWIKQCQCLSPSPDLFHKYMALKNAGKWRQSSFRDIYLPQFLREIRYSQEAANMLNYLIQKSQTENIALACFCTDETLCHRSIIAGLLQGAGADIRTDTGLDYSNYYNMYLSIK